MKNKFLTFLSYVLVAALAVTITLGVDSVLDRPQASGQSKLEQLEQLILDRFIGDADQTAIEDAAAEAMMLIGCLARRTPVYRVICGPGEEDARALHEILYHRPDEIREIEEEMKIKNGFVLRNLLDEYVVMPTGQNITEFDGTIVLNEVAAFVWSKMAEPVTRNELVEYILSEYEIDRATAERDLDALIDRLNSYGVLEDC